MRIDNVTINIHAAAQQPSPMFRAFMAALAVPPGVPEPETETTAPPALAPPPIGQEWPGQGGLYVGVVRGIEGQPDAHMVLSPLKPDGKLTWQAALDWAKTVGAPAHSDFALPTRFQSAVLYGNLRDQFETDGWYWTSTEHAECSERGAWVQNFYNGFQGYDGKSYEARARAVRLIPLVL